MDYSQVFKNRLDEADTSNPAFKEWFGKSQVVDDQGNPAVMYHGTVGTFDVFRRANDLGHHFGSPDAANDRLDFWQKYPGKNDKPNIMPVYLSIQRPISLEDTKVWDPATVAMKLSEDGVISLKEYQQVAMRSSKETRQDILVKLLKSKGFDGAEYNNEVEGKGSTSWIAFDPGQIKSVFNRGTWDRRRASINE